MYKVGIPKSAHPAMYDANVLGTQRVIDAAVEAGASRIVYVSTGNVYGNTRRKVVDESYERPQPPEFLSYYDETKWMAHEVAADRIAKGAPVVIAMPGGVYGPDDPSELGNLIDQTRTGKLKLRMFPDSGFNFVYVEDLADGILAVHDRGKIGESYNLAGQQGTLGDLIDKTAALVGPQAPAGHVAARGDEARDPDRPARRQGDGLSGQPRRADPHIRRGHVLDDRPESAQRAGVCPTRSRHGPEADPRDRVTPEVQSCRRESIEQRPQMQ